MRHRLRSCALGLVGIAIASAVHSESDIIVDPAHHRLEFENNCVRVVRASFGPGEKAAALFDAKAAVIVSVTGSHGFKTTLGSGKVIDAPPDSPGHVTWAPAGRIQPENAGDTRVEYIVVEPKGCQ